MLKPVSIRTNHTQKVQQSKVVAGPLLVSAPMKLLESTVTWLPNHKGENMVVPPRSRHVGTANRFEIICDESRLEILFFQIIYHVFTFCIVLKQYWHRSAYSTID